MGNITIVLCNHTREYMRKKNIIEKSNIRVGRLPTVVPMLTDRGRQWRSRYNEKGYEKKSLWKHTV